MTGSAGGNLPSPRLQGRETVADKSVSQWAATLERLDGGPLGLSVSHLGPELPRIVCGKPDRSEGGASHAHSGIYRGDGIGMLRWQVAGRVWRIAVQAHVAGNRGNADCTPGNVLIRHGGQWDDHRAAKAVAGRMTRMVTGVMARSTAPPWRPLRRRPGRGTGSAASSSSTGTNDGTMPMNTGSSMPVRLRRSCAAAPHPQNPTVHDHRPQEERPGYELRNQLECHRRSESREIRPVWKSMFFSGSSETSI